MSNVDISAFNYYFEHLNTDSEKIGKLTKELKGYANSGKNKEHIYVIQSALADIKEYPYLYRDAIIVLIPRYKILFINLGDNSSEFENYCDDVLLDLAALSKKYQYLQHIGRPRDWAKVIEYMNSDNLSVENIINREKINLPKDLRLIELLISLFTGSINDINKIGGIITPESTLDKVKNKILLFDTTQTNFLYENKLKKRLVIQGLSGTGKTELLLHKLKELYTDNNSDRICFTCHNRILASNLKKRITPFFNFMKVDSQIEWNERLWCHRAWGTLNDIHSGAYRYICHFYNIPFLNLSNAQQDFAQACKIALEKIQNESLNDNKYAFDYMLIDESQDFSEEFFSLCERVTKNRIYIAGDIFQSIFGTQNNLQGIDYLLNQCYRTEPKTLMFAHALGMGLFEDKKLQWPSDEEWNAYGYKINISNSTTIGKNYTLTRTPIRRFEDLPTDGCIEFENIGSNNDLSNVAKNIVSKIIDIKNENPSLVPSDIAIILLNTNRDYNSRVSYTIENVLVEEGIDWKVNRAFETQTHIENHLCITNHNNVKGLEFPFVICYSPNELGDNIKFRNAIYMALTRSFIKSILYIPVTEKNTCKQYRIGLERILKNGEINCVEPTQENMVSIQRLNLKFDEASAKSFKDLVNDAIKSLNMNLSEEEKSYYMDFILKRKGEVYDVNIIKEMLTKLREI